MASAPHVPARPVCETIAVGPLRIRFLVTGAGSNGGASVFEMTVPAGEQLPSPPHSHDGFEETVYGLAGTLVWTVAGLPSPIGPGQALCVPRGAVHRFANASAADATVLVILTPAVLGPDYFWEVAAVLAAAGDGPPDRARMVEIMDRHGLTPAPAGA